MTNWQRHSDEVSKTNETESACYFNMLVRPTVLLYMTQMRWLTDYKIRTLKL